MELTRREFILLSGAALATLALPLGAAAGRSGAVPVLLYHDISTHFRDPFTIAPSLFAAQMEWLYAAGYRAVTLHEALASRWEGTGKTVVITFDDGYASFIDYALPLFLEYGFSSTIAVIGAHVGSYLEREGRRPMLSWDEYRFLASGGVEVACHCHNLHALNRLRNATPKEVEDDLLLFQRTMEREMGRRARVLAWPYGIYDRQRIESARRAGFTAILTSNEGYLDSGSDPAEIPRLNIDNRLDLVSFSQYLGGK